MTARYCITAILLIAALARCTTEYDCADLQIQPAFIGFNLADIDTIVLKKFKAGGNYQIFIDSFIITHGYSGSYRVSNDTTRVSVTDGKNGIKTGFDWQIFIPAKNKTVFISDIVSDKKTGKRGHGIFSMDPAPGCTNDIFSVKMDNQFVNFSNQGMGGYYVFIRN
jgi:hypothetical protein